MFAKRPNPIWRGIASPFLWLKQHVESEFCWSRMVQRLLILAFPHVFPSLDHLSPLYKFPSLDQNHLFPPIFPGKRGKKGKRLKMLNPPKKKKKTKKHFFPPQSQALMASGLPAPSSGSPRLQRSAHARVPWPGRGRLFQSPVPEGWLKNAENPHEKWHFLAWSIWMFMDVYGIGMHWTIQKLSFESDVQLFWRLFCWRCNQRVSLFHCFGENQMIFWGLT